VRRRLFQKSPSKPGESEEVAEVELATTSSKVSSKTCTDAHSLGLSFEGLQKGVVQKQKRRRLAARQLTLSKESAANVEAHTIEKSISKILFVGKICEDIATEESILGMPREELDAGLAVLDKEGVPLELPTRWSLVTRAGYDEAASVVEGRDANFEKLFNTIDAWKDIEDAPSVDVVEQFDSKKPKSMDCLQAGPFMDTEKGAAKRARDRAVDIYLRVLMERVLLTLAEKTDNDSKATILPKLRALEQKLLDHNSGKYNEAADANGMVVTLTRAFMHALDPLDVEFDSDFYDAQQMTASKDVTGSELVVATWKRLRSCRSCVRWPTSTNLLPVPIRKR